jgi:hypothetical protein
MKILSYIGLLVQTEHMQLLLRIKRKKNRATEHIMMGIYYQNREPTHIVIQIFERRDIRKY